jgi:hypothetical protein
VLPCAFTDLYIEVWPAEDMPVCSMRLAQAWRAVQHHPRSFLKLCQRDDHAWQSTDSVSANVAQVDVFEPVYTNFMLHAEPLDAFTDIEQVSLMLCADHNAGVRVCSTTADDLNERTHWQPVSLVQHDSVSGVWLLQRECSCSCSHQAAA